MTKTAEKICLDKALRLLGRREHSCMELSRKLKQRGFLPDVITATVSACERMNYVDDRRFCDGYTGQLRRRGYGMMRIVQKLKEKGVAEAIIRESIDKICPEVCQVEDCRRVIDKRIPAEQTAPLDEKSRVRLFRFLYQRGFSSDVIKEAMQKNRRLNISGTSPPT